jgi:hypothetical protein
MTAIGLTKNWVGRGLAVERGEFLLARDVERRTTREVASAADVMRRGLALRRRVLEHLRAIGQPSFPLNQAEILTLGLISALEDATIIEVEDDKICAALQSARQEGELQARTPAKSRLEKSERIISLVALPCLGEIAKSFRPGSSVLIYGFAGLIQPGLLASVPPGFCILPLSTQSPALWSVGLAWLAPVEAPARVVATAERLCGILADRELDAFWLFERVQQLEKNAVRNAEEKVEVATQTRIQELEHEIAALRRAGLVQQHFLLSEATRAR